MGLVLLAPVSTSAFVDILSRASLLYATFLSSLSG
jgi:hypothetical protein